MVGNLSSVGGEVIRMARRGYGAHVSVANVHMLVAAQRDPELRGLLERAFMVVSDGMPFVRRLRACGFPQAHQVRGPDLMMEVCRRAAEENLPIYFYGGDDALMAKLRAELVRRLPNLQIAGCHAAPGLPLRPAADPALVKRIRILTPTSSFLGLGCPSRSSGWAHTARHLNAVLIGVGQAFAIAAGQQPEAPLWMRERCLEWLYRLCREPNAWGHVISSPTASTWSIASARLSPRDPDDWRRDQAGRGRIECEQRFGHSAPALPTKNLATEVATGRCFLGIHGRMPKAGETPMAENLSTHRSIALRDSTDLVHRDAYARNLANSLCANTERRSSTRLGLSQPVRADPTETPCRGAAARLRTGAPPASASKTRWPGRGRRRRVRGRERASGSARGSHPRA